MDNGTITIILWSCIVGYACYKFYKFGHSLNAILVNVSKAETATSGNCYLMQVTEEVITKDYWFYLTIQM